MPQRGRRDLAIFALFALIAVGCSARKVAYNWADRLLLNMIDSALDLSPEQERFLAPRLAGHLAWHRQVELMRYVGTLEQLEDKLRDGAAREELMWFLAELREAGKRAASRVAPDVGIFLSTLTERQIARIEAMTLDRQAKRLGRPGQSEEEYVERMLREARRLGKRWLGGLTPEQITEIERFARSTRDSETRRRHLLLVKQREFIVTLSSRPGAKALETLVSEWVAGRKQTREYAEAEARAQEKMIELLVTLDRTLLPTQRSHLLREIGSLRNDLRDLAASKMN